MIYIALRHIEVPPPRNNNVAAANKIQSVSKILQIAFHEIPDYATTGFVNTVPAIGCSVNVTCPGRYNRYRNRISALKAKRKYHSPVHSCNWQLVN